MMLLAKKLSRDEEGAGTVELAISLPVLVMMIYGIFTLGQALEATAGMQHAMGEGARYGNLCLGVTTGSCTLPTAKAIKDTVNAKLFGNNGTFDTPTVDTSTASSGYVTVSVAYHQTMNFLLFTGPTINITRSKVVYLADSPPSSATCSSPPSGTTAPASCSIYTTT
jgi:Flp pilus assembly protein TadG